MRGRREPEGTSARRRAHRDVVAAKKGDPCIDCGNKFPPECMDFDHVRGEKVADISRLVRRVSLEKVLAEIEKCDLVCANCHRIRTNRRVQPGRIGGNVVLPSSCDATSGCAPTL